MTGRQTRLEAISTHSPIKSCQANKTILIRLFTFRYILLLSLTIACQTKLNKADDGSAIDFGALANLATNLGNNPQIMSMVSNFLNQNNQKSAPALNGPSPGSSSLSNLNQQSDFGPNAQDDLNLNTIQTDLTQSASLPNEQVPIKRMKPQVPSSTSTDSSTKPVASPVAPAPGGGNLGSLMSLLPSILPNLNLSGLSNMVGDGQKPVSGQSTTTATSTSAAATSTASSSPALAAPRPALSQADTSSPSSSQTNMPQTTPQPYQHHQLNGAQSVLNQVLAAYANGQIPTELIQLGLSGRVPPQIIELALSGQVPPQLIQMVITGQVPLPTINAFLATIQHPGNQSKLAATTVNSKSATKSTSDPSPPSNSITKSIFENLFSRGDAKEGRTSLTVPTLLGPVPLQIPSFPNVRRFGQLVGGTITNVASMIPFRR